MKAILTAVLAIFSLSNIYSQPTITKKCNRVIKQDIYAYLTRTATVISSDTIKGVVEFYNASECTPFATAKIYKRGKSYPKTVFYYQQAFDNDEGYESISKEGEIYTAYDDDGKIIHQSQPGWSLSVVAVNNVAYLLETQDKTTIVYALQGNTTGLVVPGGKANLNPVYPNPGGSRVVLPVSGGGWLVDGSGRQVMALPVSAGPVAIDISGLAPGVYSWPGGQIVKE